MKRLMLNIFAGVMAAALLTGCQKAEEGQAKEESISGVVVREDAGEKEEEKAELDKAGKEETVKDDDKESVLDGAELLEDKEEELGQTESGTISIVLGGIQLEIPREYGCFIEEDKGPIVYRDDLFAMLLAVREESYEDRMEEPDSLMDGAIEAGGMITKVIAEEKIGERPYAWFTYSQNGNDFVVIYTPAADSGKRLCAQLVKEGSDVSDKELVERFSEIAESARVTDEPDTTDESLTELMRLADFGEKKTESTLKYRDNEIIFQVEPDFYSQFAETDEYWAIEYFTEPSNLNTVDCYLEPVEDGWDAEDYIDNEMKYAEEDGEIREDALKVDGNTFYYYIISYEHNGSSFQKMLAVSDVKKGYVYVVKAVYIDDAEQMEPEDFENFFHFKVR